MAMFDGLRRQWRSAPAPVRTFGPVVVMLAVALLLPLVTSTGAGGILPKATLVFCAVYALFSMGLNIVVGYAGLLDLGYVAFFLFGAYVAAWLMSDFWYTKNLHFLDTALPSIAGIHISFWLVMIVAALVAALAGVIIGFLDRNDAHHEQARAALTGARRTRDRLASGRALSPDAGAGRLRCIRRSDSARVRINADGRVAKARYAGQPARLFAFPR